MNCPKCGGDMWDERQGKFWGTGLTPNGKNKPTHKCKDKECAKNGGVAWEKSSGANGGPAVARQQSPAEPTRHSEAKSPPSSALAPLYVECLASARQAIIAAGLKNASPSDVIAAAATLFIAATRDGRPVSGAVAAPKAAAPKAAVSRRDVEEEFDAVPVEEEVPF